MQQLGLRLALAALIAAFVSAPAFAQTTSSISGTVADQDGGAVPGATVTAKNNATGATFTTYSGAQGQFSIPAVATGTFTVTVALDGFKTAVLTNVVVSVAGPATVRAVLEVGSVAETVNVQAASEIIQTQATTVSSTINTKEIQNLPLTSRSVLDFVTTLPGVNTPAGSRNSTINGLDQSSINITLDGINVQDNTLKTTDGFFAIVNPRLDAIEEVTVSAAAQTADAAGTGAVQIKFVTRGGSNAYTGSIYHYYRHDRLNENNWFNIRNGVDKPTLLQNQPGGRIGGPIVIPGLFDGHNRAFFFVNYEEFRQPRQITRNRTVLSPEAQAGQFRYLVAGQARSVDLYALATANGLPNTPDPTVRQLLADIRASTGTTGAITDLTDPNLDRYSFNVDQRSLNRFPTVRIDVNLSERHRLSSSLNYQKYLSVPDTLNGRDASFPGFPVTATQQSTRIGFSNSLRSNFGANMVNELRVGGSGAPVLFFPELTASMWSGSLANQAGFLLGINTALITNGSPSGSVQSRNAYTWLLENTVNWQAGDHGLNFGGSYSEILIWMKNQNLVPTISFDQITGTVGDGVFAVSGNFPGGSAANRNDAEDLYSVLVGSVSAINGEARISAATDEYVAQGESLQEGKVRDFAFWVQDAWRPRPDLTINLGLRYEFQLPFQALNGSYSGTTIEDVWGISGYKAGCDLSSVTPETCNIFKPGLEPGKAVTQYYQLNAGVDLFNMDWDNLAPSAGLAWTPSTETGGWLDRFLGQPGDTVFRAGFSRSYQRNGMSDFTGVLDDNPGLIIQDVDRNDDRDNILPAGRQWLLLREGPAALAPAPFPLTRQYPMTDSDTEDVAWFDPNLQVPYADTWSAGWQRALTRNMAFEVRYVGTRSRDLWTVYDYNGEFNVHENGVLAEFQLAQQNLLANLAAGRGGNFRYFGPGTGTSPLPISLAYFSGRTDAGNAAAYGSGNFASSTFIDELDPRDPNVFDFAENLQDNTGRRANALATGLPSNFLLVNPNKTDGAEIRGNGGFTNYNSLQVELRRRMSSGLQFQASYVFGRAYNSAFYSFRVPRVKQLDGGGEGGVTHAIKGNWVFELPFGQGRRFGGNVGRAMDLLIGGWQVHGIARFQSGQIINFGDVRMVGFDLDDLKGMYKARLDADKNVFFLPDDVIDNTIKAFATNPTSPTGYSADGPPEGRYFAPAGGPDCLETVADGYGSCGERDIFMDAPWMKNVDLSVVKAVPIAGRVRAEFRIEMLNAFNTINYNPATGVGSSTRDGFETNSLTGLTQSRIIQLVSRVSW